jgi:hypothetical protein
VEGCGALAKINGMWGFVAGEHLQDCLETLRQLSNRHARRRAPALGAELLVSCISNHCRRRLLGPCRAGRWPQNLLTPCSAQPQPFEASAQVQAPIVTNSCILCPCLFSQSSLNVMLRDWPTSGTPTLYKRHTVSVCRGAMKRGAHTLGAGVVNDDVEFLSRWGGVGHLRANAVTVKARPAGWGV